MLSPTLTRRNGKERWVSRSEKVAPVSRSKETEDFNTMIITQDSMLEMAVVRPRRPGPPQSFMAGPRILAEG